MGTPGQEGGCGDPWVGGVSSQVPQKPTQNPPRGAGSQPAAQPSLAQFGPQSHLIARALRASYTPRQHAAAPRMPGGTFVGGHLPTSSLPPITGLPPKQASLHGAPVVPRGSGAWGHGRCCGAVCMGVGGAGWSREQPPHPRVKSSSGNHGSQILGKTRRRRKEKLPSSPGSGDAIWPRPRAAGAVPRGRVRAGAGREGSQHGQRWAAQATLP